MECLRISMYIQKGKKVAHVYAWPFHTAKNKTIRDKHTHTHTNTIAQHSKKKHVSILLKLHTPPHVTSLPSSPCFHLIEAGVGEREQNMCYSELSTHCGPRQGSPPPNLCPMLTQSLRPHLMPFQTDLNIWQSAKKKSTRRPSPFFSSCSPKPLLLNI